MRVSAGYPSDQAWYISHDASTVPKRGLPARVGEVAMSTLEARITCWAIALLALTQLLTYTVWRTALAAILLLVIVALTTEDRS